MGKYKWEAQAGNGDWYSVSLLRAVALASDGVAIRGFMRSEGGAV